MAGAAVNPDEEPTPDAVDRLWRMLHQREHPSGHDDTPLTQDETHEVSLMESGFNEPRVDWYDRLGSFAAFLFVAIILTVLVGSLLIPLIQWIFR